MATGIVLIVAEKLYAVLHSQELREICSMFGYESQLDDLGVTVSTVKCLLLDAESKHQELTHGGREYIERLKDVVYDVDDLLDEFNTMVQKEKYRKGGKISKKVCRFFSRSNQFLIAFNMSHEIKNLRGKLDKISKDHQQFGLSDVYVPLKRKDATFSYASEASIIGRERDKEAIVSMLLGNSKSSNHVGDNISFVSIVGIGGLGKTALAKLVYNDLRIEHEFELRLWVCISEDFGMEKIFCQMLGKDVSKTEELQREVRKLIEGKKYLLVLDDAWSESRDEWDNMKSFLNLGSKGSKIVVTSRSKKVAKVVGDDMIYELKGLSGEDSWNLFKRLAFKQGKEPLSSDDHLFDIGKEIVKKCANVPLSIRVVGSMLYDQDESKWISIKSTNLMKMGQGQDVIMPIIKFSYYHLTASLKSCFSYCALFPKDFPINKELLIKLWVAQGCLDQIDNNRSEEDVGEEWFSILLQRCFLQDVRKDEYGEIESCKMHDLIHDLAQEVAGKEAVMLDPRAGQFDHKIRHLSSDRSYSLVTPITQFCEMKTLRTFLRVASPGGNLSSLRVSPICSHLRRLRILDLGCCDITSLPDTIGNLLHLRYLDLSWNDRLEVLPNSITKLHNLQVLNLDWTDVRALPRDIGKLINLRHLSLLGFHPFTHMPAGVDKLICLRTLTMFEVGNETSSQNSHISKLRDLQALVNLRGELNIEFNDNSSCDVANYKEVEILREAHLKILRILFRVQESIHDEIILACLQPHDSKLKEITIERYKGIKLPTWAESLTASLPHLVKIDLMNFDRLEILPSLSQLRHLKDLKLRGMPNVEFLESGVGIGPCDQLRFFPSLRYLELTSFPKLKGWWKEEISRVAGASSVVTPSFSHLYELSVRDCPRLTALPSCPNLKSLELFRCNEALTFLGPSSSLSPVVRMLDEVMTDNVGALEYLFGESFGGIYYLWVRSFKEESFSGVYVKYASSIKDLVIECCTNLRSLSGGGLEHLTSLLSLKISDCINLDLENNEKGVMPWKSLHFLSSLSLNGLPKLLNLPKEFQYLTSLQRLQICNCINLDLENNEDEVMPWKSLHNLSSLTLYHPKLLYVPKGFQHLTSLQYLAITCENLEAMPEWLNSLSSLKSLFINSCRKLKSLPESIGRMPSLTNLTIFRCENLNRRCREPDGEDWPKVRHIIHIDIL